MYLIWLLLFLYGFEEVMEKQEEEWQEDLWKLSARELSVVGV